MALKLAIVQRTADQWFSAALAYEQEGKGTMAATALQAALRAEQEEKRAMMGSKPTIALASTN